MKPGSSIESPSPPLRRDWLASVALIAVLLYAALAGFRTVADTDLFWQMRDARYLAETGQIARHDVFSYTAAGRPWTYPQGAGLIFYGLFRLRGYAALTWLSTLACAATTAALLALRPGILTAAAAGLAVPLVAWRTSARAELFTTFLFALFLVLLLKGRAERPLWLLPLLMAAWVNLHPGFVLGLGLLLLFLACKLVLREPVRPLAVVTSLSLLATLLNPFGPAVWRVVWQQARETAYHRVFITEWWPSGWSWWRLTELLKWRDPDGAFWVLFFIGAAALALLAWRRSWVLMGLVLCFGAVSLSSLRFQALFGMVVAAAVAEVSGAAQGGPESSARVRAGIRTAAAGLVVLVIGLRAADLVTNRYYFSHPQNSVFGAGLSHFFPERAAGFIERERLPGRLLHNYDLGGYWSWKLGRAYPVFVDGRAIPFGSEMMAENVRGLQLDPGSPEWRAFMDRWGIQTIALGLDRFHGYGVPLRRMCESAELRLVYLDEGSAVFVRNLPSTQPWAARLAKSCETVALPARPEDDPPYLYFAHAARLYLELGRTSEAGRAVEQARHYFADDPELHLQAGRVMLAEGRNADAEREFRSAVRIEGSSRAWFSLGVLQAGAGRHREAIASFTRAVRVAPLPFEGYRAIGESYLALKEPRQALPWFEEALAARDSAAARAILPPGFVGAVYAGVARARFMMGELAAAESALQAAVAARPDDPALHLMRAEFYLGQGRPGLAREALARAQALGASGPLVLRLQQQLGK